MMLFLYRGLLLLGAPLIWFYIHFRRFSGKEDTTRFKERFGHPSIGRPDENLIWVHAASIGESLSMLPLIGRLIGESKKINILVTTGTVTSAQMMEERLPERTFHQFAPIDQTLFVRRFLDHWRPDLALWAESEFWPNMITETANRKIPMVLVNGRVSLKSFAGWGNFNSLIKKLLSCFDLCLGQSDVDVWRLRQLGSKTTKYVGNLKFSSFLLPFDRSELLELTNKIGSRPIWLAASTHAGEEDISVQIHQGLKGSNVGLLTIIVPRNPKRGKKIAVQIRQRGISVALRSNGDSIKSSTEFYIADTIGEMGLFFRIANVVFIGKSLVPFGGQNPLEAARLGCAIVYGPHMMNFEDVSIRMKKANAAIQVQDTEELLTSIQGLLGDKLYCERMAASAKVFAANESGALDAVFTELVPFIEKFSFKDSSSENT